MKTQGLVAAEETVEFIRNKARLLRWDIVKMIGMAGSGHPGGSLSAADIVAVLFFHQMKHRPDDPKWKERDRFVLSKGHAAPVLYAALAESGYFSRDELWTLRKLGSRLQGHPDMLKTPGVEISTGSLGQGLSVAVGMALGLRLSGIPSKVYALIGDGESQEGLIWEASMYAAHKRLDNLVGILDYNDLQIDGRVSDISDIAPAADKWRAFGWHVLEIDGHDVPQILASFREAQEAKGKPTMIVARTVKGKGVSFMENQVDFHGKPPTPEEMEKALAEIESSGSMD